MIDSLTHSAGPPVRTSAGPPQAEQWSGNAAKAEADHRIANNLALVISLVRVRAFRMARNRGSVSAADAAGVLDDIATRLETAASLHRLLSQEPDAVTVDIAAFLKELCGTLTVTAAERGDVAYIGEGQPCMVPADAVLGLALIVTEAVTNAVKYAHPSGLPTTVTVRCVEAADGGVTVAIEDDGVGLPEGFDPHSAGGLGFQTMRMLAEHLGAALEFDSGPLGLRCTITINPGPDATAP